VDNTGLFLNPGGAEWLEPGREGNGRTSERSSTREVTGFPRAKSSEKPSEEIGRRCEQNWAYRASAVVGTVVAGG